MKTNTETTAGGIKDSLRRYWEELVPFREKTLKDARNAVQNKEEEILGQIVDSIHQAISNEKWKKLLEKKVSFQNPSDRSTGHGKHILFAVIDDGLKNPGTRLRTSNQINLSKSEILECGFNSWKEVFQTINEFNNSVEGSINLRSNIHFDMPGKNYEDTENISFSLTVR